MKLNCHPFQLRFRHTFRIAAGSRETTDTVFVSLEEGEMTGYGEAALPPYLKETVQSVVDDISRLNIPEKYKTEDFFPLLEEWQYECSNMPALAAMDIALHDLQGKLLGRPSRSIYNISGAVPLTAYTLGVSTAAEMQSKRTEAGEFAFFKLKLDGTNDKECIDTFRQISSSPFGVDVNRGWKDEAYAVELCRHLERAGCTFIEQPFERDMLKQTAILGKKTKIPIILDESVQTISDVEKVKDCCDGINIKLVKSGGMNRAWQMINLAKQYGLKIFLGCMSESSCGIAGAAQLAPLAHWVDLDGPLLISNDPFTGLEYNKGRIVLSESPGNGIALK